MLGGEKVKGIEALCTKMQGIFHVREISILVVYSLIHGASWGKAFAVQVHYIEDREVTKIS
ncbi:MAG: hypothetical protein C0407_10050 [Desulfobacca sp.]|nr:hypothetical protein [Desulfobacca sp.]